MALTEKQLSKTFNNGAFYRLYSEHPPLRDDGSRRRGSTAADEYWRGFDGGKTMSQRGGIGWLAHQAGKEAKLRE